MKRPTCRPRVEELEPRRTPSATGVHTLPAMLAVPGHITHPPATGLLTGFFTSLFHNPDSGTPYSLTGSGGVAGLGQVSVTASLQTVGMLNNGQASGTLTMSNAHGTLTFSLTGPTQPGFSALPTQFTSTITGGTGRYKHLRGTGTATLQLERILLGTAIACFPQPKGCPDMGAFRLRLT